MQQHPLEAKRSTAMSVGVDDVVQTLSVLVVCALVIGLSLAIADRFYPFLFLAVFIPVVAGAVWLLQRGRDSNPEHREPPTETGAQGGWSTRLPWLAAILGLMVIAVITTLNVTSSSEHLLTDRDPGVYLATGKWLANNHTLLVDGTIGGFESVPWIDGTSQGFHPRSDSLVYAQFNHGFPVALALGAWVGGDRLMLNMTPLIGGVLLVLLFLLLTRMFSPWIAFISIGTVAFNLVFWHFSRDAYSEPLVALLLVLGLLAVHRALVYESQQSWLLASALIGSVSLVRIDAWFYIGTFTLLLAIQATLNRSPGLTRSTAVGSIGLMWAIGALGVVDLVLRSPAYFRHLSGSVSLMLGFAAVCGMIALAMLILATFLPIAARNAVERLWSRSERYWRAAGGALLGLFVFWAVIWRPRFSVDGSGRPGWIVELIEREGVSDNGTRSFFEWSGRWFTWYWGWVTVAVATAGWIAAVARRRFDERRLFWIAMVLTGLTLVPYIVDPSITPDQVWAMRRFYPAGLIGIAIAVAVTTLLLAHSRLRSSYVGVASAVAIWLGVAAVPLWYALPLASASTQVGVYGSVMQLCDELPDDAALLVVDEYLGRMLVAAPRSFCGVPVARTAQVVAAAEINEVALRWQDRGKTLFLLSQDSGSLPGGSPAQLVAEMAFGYKQPEYTLSRRPSALVERSLRWQLWAWDPARE